MAIQNTFYLDVDIKRDNYVDEPKVTQNDAVTFVLRMTDDGVDYPLTGVSTYTLASLRPDNQSVLTVGTLTGVNEITFELGSTEVSVPGNVKAAIQLYDVDGRVSSIPFTYEVTKDIATGYIPSKEEKTLIELVLGQGPAILTAAQTATITANDAAANANAKAALANAEAQDANAAGIYARDKGLLAEQKAALADASANEADTATYNAENATQEAKDATNAINAVLPNVEGLENRGEYNSATTYVKNNLIERNGSSWQALQDTQGNPPPTLPTKSNAYWTLVAQRGVDGMGSVSTVNGEGPDVNGNVSITIPDPDLSGLATKAELQTLDDEVTRRIENISFDVKEFGAKGDGITDDTNSIKDAILASNAVKGTLFFPPGTYMYSAILNPANDTTWVGVRGSSILKMKSGDIPTYGVVNIGNLINFNVIGLSFIGNEISQPSNPGTSEPAFFLLNCEDITFENCYFSGYMGIGIAFQGGKNTKVIRCRFKNHGQDLTTWRGLSPKAVPAIWAAYGNEGLLVDSCEFEDCRWSAVFMLGKRGTVKNCKIDTVGESGIYSEYSDTSPTGHNLVTNNQIFNTYMIDVTACGIEWSTPHSILSNNTITGCDADGIALSNCSFVNVENNIISNCNQHGFAFGGGIGLAYKDGITLPTQGIGININNNTCYDDQAVKTQTYGIYVTNHGGSGLFSNSKIINNILYNNLSKNFQIEGNSFSDPSNNFSGDEWHIPTLLNNWVNYGGGYSTVGYYKDQSGRVFLKGFIKSGIVTPGTILFKLPLGYRPIATQSISSVSNSGGTPTPCVIDVAQTGEVAIGAFTAGSNWLCLDGVSFNVQ